MTSAEEFESYYGRPVLKPPVWKVPDVPLYLYLGGAAGASSTMALLADLTGRRDLARAGRLTAAVGATASVGALVHDLGRPMRFLNMLRVFKPTSLTARPSSRSCSRSWPSGGTRWPGRFP
ncbi:NrfD/PsrC family molybdoenzyme membrane anchor subunit, partial [Saccharopolyspora sp. NPDC002686]|uniref:NrfD/PsrC family molybdoenzyme membrane anchor subunit n=1 Tax=Saccharopolyspora sp. NPDC002686 TaxID=3154541 RepID=UPI003326844E